MDREAEITNSTEKTNNDADTTNRPGETNESSKTSKGTENANEAPDIANRPAETKKNTETPNSIENTNKDADIADRPGETDNTHETPDSTENANKDADRPKGKRKNAQNILREATQANISSRISSYIEKNKKIGMTQAKFAKNIGASSSSVNRWASLASKDLPPVYYLKPIADEIGITIDSLITGTDVALARPKYRTYSAAFLSLSELVDIGVIQPYSEDPFLDWLIKKKASIDRMKNVSDAKKNEWVARVAADYDKPMLPPYLTQYIKLFKYTFTEIEEYDTYLTVFRLFQGYASGKTKDDVDELIQQWHNSVKKDTGEYENIEVPYGGGDKMYALDEDGKIILVDKPQKEVWVEATPDDIPDDDNLPFS